METNGINYPDQLDDLDELPEVSEEQLEEEMSRLEDESTEPDL